MTMTGEITDYVLNEEGVWVPIYTGTNLVVSTAYVAAAMAMKRDPAYGGFMWWALGDGDGSDTATWDAGVDAGSIAPNVSDTTLDNEVFRKEITASDIDFIDPGNNVVASPTNRLQIDVLFQEDEPSAGGSTFLREWGIFGGDATATADSGYLINRKVHPTYEKTNFTQLRRILRFSFAS